MRNLKKVLSLALAVVMLIGMMVIGASAATTYTDGASISADNREAVEVMTGIGVLTGTDTGAFNPKGNLTREQAAAIIARTTLGPVVAGALTATTTPFADVPSTSWASGVIAYCAAEGIIGGRDDGLFHPWDNVKGTEFAKMLLVAIGSDSSRYVGGSWDINVQRDALSAKLTEGITMNWNADLTREQASQMAFNALQYSPSGATVEYVVKNASGTVIYQGTDAMQAALVNQLINSGDATKLTTTTTAPDSLGSQVFKLVSKDTTDSFGRATKTWESNSKSVAVIDGGAAVKTYMTATSSAGTDLDGLAFAAATELYTNGTKTTPYTASTDVGTTINGLAGNGKVVEIYASNNTITKVVVIEYSVGTLDIAANGNYSVKDIGDSTHTLLASTEAKNVVASGTVAKGDIVTGAIAGGKLYIYPTQKIEGVQTGYNTTANTVVVNGTTYTVGTSVKIKDGAVDATALRTLDGATKNFYVDANGFVVYSNNITTAASTNYAQLKGSYVSNVVTTVDGKTPTVQARFVLSDGTVNVYNVELTKNGSGGWDLLGSEVLGAAESLSNMNSKLDPMLTDGSVFGYTLDGNTIKLEAKTAISDANLGDKAVVTGATSADYTGDNTVALTNSKTALITSSTVFVLYNASSNTAICLVGPASLPQGTKLDSGEAKVVMTAANTTAGVASVVFGLYTVAPANTGNYVYVNHAAYSVNLNSAGTPVRTYAGIAPDGTTVAVTGPAGGAKGVVASGVYNYRSDNSIDVDTQMTGTGITSQAVATVVGGSLITVNNSNYYTINADTKTALVDKSLEGADGNQCIVIYKDGVALTIYVVAAAPAPHVHGNWASDWTVSAAGHYHLCGNAGCTLNAAQYADGTTLTGADATGAAYAEHSDGNATSYTVSDGRCYHGCDQAGCTAHVDEANHTAKPSPAASDYIRGDDNNGGTTSQHSVKCNHCEGATTWVTCTATLDPSDTGTSDTCVCGRTGL